MPMCRILKPLKIGAQRYPAGAIMHVPDHLARQYEASGVVVPHGGDAKQTNAYPNAYILRKK